MKTVIIGNAGSGKTWLARKLADADTEVIHLDDLFWISDGFNEKRSKEEVNQMIIHSKGYTSWICEGVFGELAEQYFDIAATLIWLDMPWELCCSRLEQRGSESKIHLGREQSKKGLQQLVEWASRYDDRKDLRSHNGHQTLFNSFCGDRVQLKSTWEVDGYVKMHKKALHRSRTRGVGGEL